MEDSAENQAVLRKIAARTEPTKGGMSAAEAGRAWALDEAAYPDLWALEQLNFALYDEDTETPLSLRIARCLGKGPDVFWYQMRGKRAVEVSHEEALNWMHAASRVFYQCCLAIKEARDGR